MAEQQPLYVLYNIGPFRSSNKNTDTQLNVYVSDKHFKIDLFTANFESPPLLLAEYLQHVQRLDPEYIPDIIEEDEVLEDPLYLSNA
ncbi:PKc-like superfamily domain-containing protein [Histoplasma ohiense]|nr:PKc-like superfamily domain-containing protein [Histoplasma ohiense (nom. inval.)]